MVLYLIHLGHEKGPLVKPSVVCQGGHGQFYPREEVVIDMQAVIALYGHQGDLAILYVIRNMKEALNIKCTYITCIGIYV